MPSRPRSGSVAVVIGRSIPPSSLSTPSKKAKNLNLSVNTAALGKRKRGQSPTTRSPSPTRSEPDSAVAKRPRRSRSRTPSVRASTAAPSTGAAANARILAALRARANVLTPAEHPRPCRQLFVWGNGDMGQFGLGPDTVCSIFSSFLNDLGYVGSLIPIYFFSLAI